MVREVPPVDQQGPGGIHRSGAGIVTIVPES